MTDIADGTTTKIKIVEKDDDGNDDEVESPNTKVQNGKIKCKWKVVYMKDNDDAESQQEQEEKGYTLPEYAFTVECDGEKSTESGQLDIKDEIEITVSNFEKLKGKTLRLSWKDGSSKEVTIDSEKLKIILENHIKFERIHPFSDGNGRTGRLIMLALMLENNLTPFVITVEDRANYMDILRGQDIENFINLVEPLIEKEKKRISAFNNSSNLQI